MAFERRQPSVDLRAFLDPLKPGSYFDCGGARLYGIDEALEAEALRRGRAVGEDEFQLVATDGGLIFCRASIMFAIAARWKDLTIGRPEDSAEDGKVQLPISWPTHGDLQFTVSRRLGSNIFRRWLQLQAQATRRSQVEQDVRLERTSASGAEPANGHSHLETVDLRGDDRVDDWPGHQEVATEIDHGSSAAPGRNGNRSNSAVSLQLDDSDRAAIEYATRQEQRRRRPFEPDDSGTNGDARRPAPSVDPLATIDAAIVDEWVDDRVPHTSRPNHTSTRPSTGASSKLRSPPPRVGPVGQPLFEDEATADPFNGYDLGPSAPPDDERAHAHSADEDAVRFDIRPAPREAESGAGVDDQDATATRFMRRTIDGTEIFPDGKTARDDAGPRRSVDRGERLERAGRAGANGLRRRVGHTGVPVPEISGARLQTTESSDSAVPRLDIRSTLLAGRRESEWVEILRRRQVLILGLVTIVALGLIALIGFLSGGDDSSGTLAATPGTADSGAIADPAGAAATQSSSSALDQEALSSSTSLAAATGAVTDGATADGATTDPTAPTLRVSSTAVQICHSNYGGCVPVAADVDCEGDGDGPAFQSTPVAVFGDDVYELDTDGDREACEADQPRLEAAAGGG